MPRKTNQVVTTCQYCGKEFSYKASQRRKFCSKTCHARTVGPPKTTATCLTCGKTFDYHASTRTGHYCSVSCGITARNLTDQNPSFRRDIRGEKNPMHGKGLTGDSNPMYGRTREQSPNWKGGRKVRKDGYVLIAAPIEHPYPAYKKGNSAYILEHRLIMERIVGRYLLPTEVVHHRDGNPSNNAPENLQLFDSQADHISQAHG